jgi:hypothetical protein
MNESWYEGVNTMGYFEDHSFDGVMLGVYAYCTSGMEYAKYDYIRIWQEVSQEPTTSLSTQESLGPIINILFPKNETYSERNAPLIFNLSEQPSWTGYSLDGQANVTIAGNTTSASLADGPHHVTFYANNTDGAMSTSNIVYFQVDATPPNITDVSQYPPADNVLAENEVRINATVADILGGVRKVTLIYAFTNSSGTWIGVTDMINIEGSIWNATIPTFPYGTNVTYAIRAEDNVNNTITTEEMGYYYQYRVIPEFPSILILQVIMLLFTLAIVFATRKLNLKTRLPTRALYVNREYRRYRHFFPLY